MTARPARLVWLAAGCVALCGLAYDPCAPAAAPKRVIGLLVAVALLALVLSAGRRSGAGTPGGVGRGAMAWTAFVALSVASLAWGRDPGFDTAGTWVAGTALLFASRSLASEQAISCARCTAWLMGFGASAIGVTQWLLGQRGIAVHGAQGNANWLGLLLACTLPLSLEWVIDGYRRRERWWFAAAVATALQVPALIVSASRVAWVAIACAAVAVLIVRGVSRSRGKSAAVACSIAVLVVAALVALPAAARLSYEPESDAGAERPAATMVPASEALAGRVWIWRASLDAAWGAQPFGTGLGGFAHAFQSAQGLRLEALPPRAASRQFHNAQTAHQDLLQALVETGVLGLLLLAVSLALAAQSFLRARWLGGFAATTTLLVCALGDSPLQQPAIVYLLALLLGAEPSTRVVHRWRAMGVGLLVVTASVLMAYATRTWLAARWVHEAQGAALERRTGLLERAVRIAPRSGEATLALGLARQEQGDAEGAIAALSRSREQLANVGTDIALGNGQLEMGNAQAAIASYRRALRLHPGSLRAHANLAEALRVAGDLDEAQRHLDTAKRLSPGHPKLPVLEENLRRSKREAGMAP